MRSCGENWGGSLQRKGELGIGMRERRQANGTTKERTNRINAGQGSKVLWKERKQARPGAQKTGYQALSKNSKEQHQQRLFVAVVTAIVHQRAGVPRTEEGSTVRKETATREEEEEEQDDVDLERERERAEAGRRDDVLLGVQTVVVGDAMRPFEATFHVPRSHPRPLSLRLSLLVRTGLAWPLNDLMMDRRIR